MKCFTKAWITSVVRRWKSGIDFSAMTINRKDKKPKEEKKTEVVAIKRYDSFPELSAAVQLNEKDISQSYVNVVVPVTAPEPAPKREDVTQFRMRISPTRLIRLQPIYVHTCSK